MATSETHQVELKVDKGSGGSWAKWGKGGVRLCFACPADFFSFWNFLFFTQNKGAPRALP